MMKKVFIPLAFVLILILLFTGCGKAATTTTTAATTTTPKITTVPATTTPPATTTTTAAIKKGGTLRYIYPYSPTSTPGWPQDNANAQRMWMEWTVFEPLVKPDKHYQPIPWLAESWDQSPDKLVTTFHLRKGVKFSDGTDFTSESVKVAAELNMAANAAFTSTWDKWEIIDANTIKLTLKFYQNDFWGNFMGINMCFFSDTAYKANGVDWMKEHPIGTGPFVFKSFQQDVSVILTANPNYWQTGKPYLAELDFLTFKETLTAQAAMQAGEGDAWALQQGKTLYDMKNAGFNVVYDYGGTDFLLFDTKNEGSITNDPKIRMAMEYAIDKQAICDALGYGYYIKNNQWSPPSNPSFNANLPSGIITLIWPGNC